MFDFHHHKTTVPIVAGHSIRLFTAQTANANGASFAWPGGKGTLWVSGTFTSGVVTLEIQDPAGNWAPLQLLAADNTKTSLSFAAAGRVGIEIGPCNIRAVLASGSSESVDAGIL